MSDDDVSVNLSANIAELLASFNEASAQIAASLASIEDKVGQTSNVLEQRMAPAAEHAAESLHKIEEESGGVGAALENIKGKMAEFAEFTGLALIYEALEKAKEEFDELSERAIEFEHIGESLGIGAVALQGLEAAANESGVSTSKLERAMFTLTQRMEQAREEGGEAADKFNKLGISNKMLGDSSFTAVDAMQILGRETNSNSELIGLLGARMAMVVPMLREMAQNHELAAEGAERVNALLPSEIAAMTEYHGVVSTLSEQFENLLSRGLIQTLPALEEMIQDFKELSQVGETGQTFIAELVYGLRGLVTAGTTAAFVIKGLVDVVINAAKLIIDPIVSLNVAMYELGTGNFQGAKQVLISGFNDIGKNWHKVVDDFVADGQRVEQATKGMWDATAGLDQESVQGWGKEKKEQKPVGKYDDSAYMAFMKDRLKIHEDMIKQELKDDEDYLSLSVKNASDQNKAVMDAQVGASKIAEGLLDEKAKTEMFGNVQELNNYKAVIQQKLAAQIAFYDQEEAMAAAEGKDTQKFEDEKVKAHAAADAEMLKADQKATAQIPQAWDGVFKPIEASFTDNITKMIEGTESFGQAWRSILSTILDTFIKTIVNMVTQWLLGMLENVAVSKTAALSQITANSGIAATAAMASVAAIPLVGWALAPEIGAATFAEGMAYSASISAAGGADIPAGVNPRAQLHEREMVLPAHIADPLRSMLSGNSGGKRHTVLNVNNLDSDHFFVKKSELQNHVKDVNRRFGFGTRGNF